MLKSNEDKIKEWANQDDALILEQQDDVFIVERGFPDSLELLEDLHIRAKMTAFLKKGEKQMTEEYANINLMDNQCW